MEKIELYGKTRTGKTKYWSAWVVERGASGHPEIHYEWGMVDGKKQLTVDVIDKGVNEGKANETTPLEQAKLTLDRKAKKKSEEGYTSNVDDTDNCNDSFDLSKRFPKELCFYKPKNSITENKIRELDKVGRAVYTVKRDGMMHIIRKTNELGVEIYSRRMDLMTDKYPHIVEELQNIPFSFVLLGEIILDKDGKDDFKSVSSICRSDPDKAIQRQKELGLVKYYIFDIAFMSGKGGSPWLPCLLTNETYLDRIDLFESNIGCHLKSDSHIQLCELLNYEPQSDGRFVHERFNGKSHKKCLKEMVDRGLEGLVVWDANGKMNEGEAYTLNGKAYRPNILWKSKPKYEDDFIVRFDPTNGIGEFGSGKNKNKVKSVYIYQIDENGNEVFLGKCGGGLSDQQRDFYTSSEYPRVWCIEYDSIQPGTGSLRFPVFKSDRTSNNDKLIEECLMSDAIKKARS